MHQLLGISGSIRGRDSSRTLVIALALLLAGCLLPPATALGQEVPESSQVPIFFKLLTYDRILWENPKNQLRIGLLQHAGNEDSRRNLEAMAQALEGYSDKTVNQVPFEFTTLTWKRTDELIALLDEADVDVLYVTAGHGDFLVKISAATRKRGLLTLTGTPDYVALGLSVGLDQEDHRPRLQVNLEALAAERHQLDARVLRLCKVVKR